MKTKVKNDTDEKSDKVNRCTSRPPYKDRLWRKRQQMTTETTKTMNTNKTQH